MPDLAAGHVLYQVNSIGLEVRHVVAIAIMLHVVHGATIALAETFAEGPAVMFINRRMLVNLVVIRVGMAMISEVAARSFNTFMEAATLGVVTV